MIQQDKKEKERSEAKNSVEEYIYEIRDKLSNEYEAFILPEASAHSIWILFKPLKNLIFLIFHQQHKEQFLKSLDETESWLYSDEAEDQMKSVYVDRLQGLKVIVLFFVCLFDWPL